ncbi:hypothetical protein ABQ297_06000 [Enterobacter hormaechei]|uniref:Uncharacterized protein n=1 Tax=Enterobacter cancerogenus TaxID=69218 RepID=A0ABX8KK75_9ENTR|nr:MULTISPECIES: hypothetical protein [Enterobacter]MBT1898755.1 hypothetical protein [Enterobacter hormaechei subsp. xiangfangensis]OAE45130.1 hypothetical protein A7J56_15385 [Enterobacter cloacae]DAI68343.1 MAG TPA: Intracellular delivery domain [Caudoviricetes sp.]HCM9242804.1 hypothetical protein [Enterobacter bugandensis]HED1379066.1 hypothetical protein [Enterobacter hormaechei subsp. steigerwaltii]HED1498634.1 hypothetical protein [Enterobacter hormaechei subsp. hoffmannii]HEO9244715
MSDNIMQEIMENLIYKVDALNSIVVQMQNVLTPEQLNKFQTNTIETWKLVEEKTPHEAIETVLKTKKFAFKYSGIKE